jgi:hypothetical protein
MGTSHLYWILAGPSFAVHVGGKPGKTAPMNNILILLMLLECLHCEKRLAVFPGIIKVFLARESLVSDILAGNGKTVNLFLQCIVSWGRSPVT